MEKVKTLSQTLFFPWEISLSILAFAIPLVIAGPQWLTGTIVNSFLFIFVARSSNKILPVVILPSIGAFLHGVIFGPLTFFLFYFLPFIWIGNYLLVKIFQKLNEKKVNFFLAVFLSSVLKAGFLYSAAVGFFQLKIVPAIFLKAMGLVQFFTALAGGILAYFVVRQFNKNYDRA
jgi:hypothetical protein